jgi:DNA polymerase III alpha subunit (gram-positive type)
MIAKGTPFVHLHFHTEYSLLGGACQVNRVMETAQKLGMNAVAITDHGALGQQRTDENSGLTKYAIGVYLNPDLRAMVKEWLI